MGWIRRVLLSAPKTTAVCTFSDNFDFQMGSKQDLLRKGADTCQIPRTCQMYWQLLFKLYKTLQEGSIYWTRKLRFREVK